MRLPKSAIMKFGLFAATAACLVNTCQATPIVSSTDLEQKLADAIDDTGIFEADKRQISRLCRPFSTLFGGGKRTYVEDEHEKRTETDFNRILRLENLIEKMMNGENEHEKKQEAVPDLLNGLGKVLGKVLDKLLGDQNMDAKNKHNKRQTIDGISIPEGLLGDLDTKEENQKRPLVGFNNIISRRPPASPPSFDDGGSTTQNAGFTKEGTRSPGGLVDRDLIGNMAEGEDGG